MKTEQSLSPTEDTNLENTSFRFRVSGLLVLTTCAGLMLGTQRYFKNREEKQAKEKTVELTYDVTRGVLLETEPQIIESLEQLHIKDLESESLHALSTLSSLQLQLYRFDNVSRILKIHNNSWIAPEEREGPTYLRTTSQSRTAMTETYNSFTVPTDRQALIEQFERDKQSLITLLGDTDFPPLVPAKEDVPAYLAEISKMREAVFQLSCYYEHFGVYMPSPFQDYHPTEPMENIQDGD